MRAMTPMLSRLLMGAMALVLGAAALIVIPAAAGPAGAQTAPPLDHFLCYSAAPVAGVPGFNPPANIKLKNQFSTKYFRVTATGSADRHCNPATKILPTGTQYTPTSPSWHLLCFPITAAQKPPSHLVQVTNQFGQADLTTGPPQQLCLPSLKSESTPPVFRPPGPGEVQPDHFTCYPVTYSDATRFTPPGGITVTDQFNTGPGPVPIQVLNPVSLCLPTMKKIGRHVAARITNPTMHLLCFTTAPPTPVPTFTIWDKNQFSGPSGGGLTVSDPNGNLLCLPSTKVLLH